MWQDANISEGLDASIFKMILPIRSTVVAMAIQIL
jgi:hypothetical protein